MTGRFPAWQQKDSKAAEDAPYVEQITKLWMRFGELRRGSSRSVEEAIEALGNTYVKVDLNRYVDLERGLKIDRSTGLPYGSVLRCDVENLIKLADLFNCSLDCLLCRTDYPELVKEAPQPEVPEVNTGWKSGKPENNGRYVVMVRFSPGKEGTPQKLDWNGEDWTIFGESVGIESSQILGWIPMPEE